jgi:metal-dependent amidase/aminoacylase/carboxypeptidase family protein
MPNPRVETALLAKGLVLRGDRNLKESIAARAKQIAKEEADMFNKHLHLPTEAERKVAIAAHAYEVTKRVTKTLTDWAKRRIDDRDPLYIEYTVYDRLLDGPPSN